MRPVFFWRCGGSRITDEGRECGFCGMGISEDDNGKKECKDDESDENGSRGRKWKEGEGGGGRKARRRDTRKIYKKSSKGKMLMGLSIQFVADFDHCKVFWHRYMIDTIRLLYRLVRPAEDGPSKFTNLRVCCNAR